MAMRPSRPWRWRSSLVECQGIVQSWCCWKSNFNVGKGSSLHFSGPNAESPRDVISACIWQMNVPPTNVCTFVGCPSAVSLIFWSASRGVAVVCWVGVSWYQSQRCGNALGSQEQCCRSALECLRSQSQCCCSVSHLLWHSRFCAFSLVQFTCASGRLLEG